MVYNRSSFRKRSGAIKLFHAPVNAVITAISGNLEEIIGGISLLLTQIASAVIPLIVITLLFAMIFKFLPDADIKWKNTWVGAIVTAILFSVGRYLIGFYIGNSDIAGIYDTAGSIVVVMVWVFYTSIIFFFGSVFTYIYADAMDDQIEPSDYAVRVKKTEVANSNEA